MSAPISLEAALRLGLEFLDGGDRLAALGVEPHEVIDLGGELLPSGGEAFADVCRGFLESL